MQVDNFLKIIDVRLGMRVLNVLQFQAGECLLLLVRAICMTRVLYDTRCLLLLVWAIRMTRVLFTGPTCVSFDPKYESCVQIGSSSGTVRLFGYSRVGD